MGFEIREPGVRYAKAGIVIDNSVAMRWLVESGKSADQWYAMQVRDAVQVERLPVLAPYLWSYEAANVADFYVRRDELKFSTARKALQALYDLFTIVVDKGETPMALLEASAQYRVTSYDASYLLLARNEELPLATLNKQMRRIAKRMGVEVFAPW